MTELNSTNQHYDLVIAGQATKFPVDHPTPEGFCFSLFLMMFEFLLFDDLVFLTFLYGIIWFQDANPLFSQDHN